MASMMDDGPLGPRGMSREQAAAYAKARGHRMHCSFVVFSIGAGYGACEQQIADRLHVPYLEVVPWTPIPMRLHSHPALARWVCLLLMLLPLVGCSAAQMPSRQEQVIDGMRPAIFGPSTGVSQ